MVEKEWGCECMMVRESRMCGKRIKINELTFYCTLDRDHDGDHKACDDGVPITHGIVTWDRGGVTGGVIVESESYILAKESGCLEVEIG